MTNSDVVVELSDVGCKSGYQYLLRGVNWTVNRGERWVVFGMNGSGKTTLLSIVAGFRHFTDGTVKVFGKELSNDTIMDVRKRVGWVSASFFDRYYTRESALHIVLSGLNGSLGLDGTETLGDIARAQSLLTELGLGDKIDRTFDMLSKGERQNVLIARALIGSPEILVLDEPFTGLDVYNRSYLFSTIDKLADRQNLTIMYVTHYVEEIAPLFSKCMLMKNGHVFAQGETQELVNSAYFSELLGYPVDLQQDDAGRYTMDVETDSQIARYLDKGVKLDG